MYGSLYRLPPAGWHPSLEQVGNLNVQSLPLHVHPDVRRRLNLLVIGGRTMRLCRGLNPSTIHPLYLYVTAMGKCVFILLIFSSLFLCPPLKKEGAYCFAHVSRYVGMSVALNLITQERFAPEPSNLVGR